jgi:hypothetical protein
MAENNDRLVNEIGSFNPLSHEPPRIDSFGFIKKPKFKTSIEKTNILASGQTIPVQW